MEPFPLAKAKGLETSRGKEAILCVIEHMLSFRFQWIPPYRVYAAGERFWRVLKLEDSRWNGEEEEEVEGKKKDEKRKKQRAKAKL